MRVKLKELGEISTGNTPNKSNVEYYNSKDICFAKPDMIYESGISLIGTTKEYLSEKAREKARIAKEKAVFVTCIGSIGKVGIVCRNECAFNQQINSIMPNSKILSKYLAYNLLANRDKLQAVANAPVVPIINKTQFGEFEIDVEKDKEVQAQIVDKLDKIQALIENVRQKLRLLDTLIKSRFVEMFGDPIINNKELPTLQMKEVFFLKAGIPTEANEIHEQSVKYSIPCYGGNGIRGYVKEATQNGNYPIIGRQGALCGNVQMATGEFHATEHAILVTPLIEMNVIWLYHLLKCMDLYRYHTGAAQPGLSVKTLNTVDIPIASLISQNSFASFVSQIDKLKVVEQKRLEKLQLLFDSLMQQYFG